MSNKFEQATLTIPLTGLKFLYQNTRDHKMVCEIDVAALKKVNEPRTIEDMIAEARMEYFGGKTRAFTNTKKLMAHLRK